MTLNDADKALLGAALAGLRDGLGTGIEQLRLVGRISALARELGVELPPQTQDVCTWDTKVMGELRRQRGWPQAVVPHAIAEGADPASYGLECAVRVVGGFELRTDAFADVASYLRVVDAQVYGAGGPLELAFWDSDEVRTNPEEVMGAVMGLLRGLQEHQRERMLLQQEELQDTSAAGEDLDHVDEADVPAPRG